MKRKLISIAGLVVVGVLLLSLSNCAHDQELVGIQIQPSSETFGSSTTPVGTDQGLQVQLSALGTYIHPPVTKDITSQVTWASDDTQMVTVSPTGLVTATGGTCGSSLISATVTTNKSTGGISSSGAIVTGFMTASVVCDTSSGGGTGPALGVTFGGQGTGTIASQPGGLSCASSTQVCAVEFPVGTVVMITATPNAPSTFGAWTGCSTAPNVNPCQVTLESNTFLTVTFN